MDILDRLLGHDAWTTHQLIVRCHELDPAALHHQFDAGHGTVYATLVHMISNVRTWTDLMRGDRVVPGELSWDNLTIDDLLARSDLAAADFAALAWRVRDEGQFNALWLDTLDDPPAAKTYGGAIGHVITHNMHHRAELLHMLSRLGLTGLPEGDLLSWEATVRHP